MSSKPPSTATAERAPRTRRAVREASATATDIVDRANAANTETGTPQAAINASPTTGADTQAAPATAATSSATATSSASATPGAPEASASVSTAPRAAPAQSEPAALPPTAVAVSAANDTTSNAPQTAAPGPTSNFPPLRSPSPEFQIVEPRKKRDTGKKKAAPPSRDEDDPHLMRDLAFATATSLGIIGEEPAAANPRAPREEDDLRLQRDTAAATAASLGMIVDAPYVNQPIAGTSAEAESVNAVQAVLNKERDRQTATAKRLRADTVGNAIPTAVHQPQPPRRDYADAVAASAPQPAQPAAPPVTADVNGAEVLQPLPPFSYDRGLWPTVDGNPPRGAHVNIPRNLIIHSNLNTETIRALYTGAQNERYDAVAHPKFWVFVAGGPGVSMTTRERIRESIASAVNADPMSFEVGMPPVNRDNGPNPLGFLIAKLDAGQAMWLLQRQVLATPTITLFTFPYSPPLSGYIATFVGFVIPQTEHGAELALALIRDAANADRNIVQHIRTYRDDMPATISADAAVARFFESLGVASIELLLPDNISVVAWNVYGTPPTTIVSAWTGLRNLFTRLIIDTVWNGQGYAYGKPLRCQICPGIDHPTARCPLLQLPEWPGPFPNNIGDLLQASRNAARPPAPPSLNPGGIDNPPGQGPSRGGGGRGGRGRGNGRGRHNDKGNGRQKGGKGRRDDYDY